MKSLNFIKTIAFVGVLMFISASFTTAYNSDVKFPKWLEGQWEGVGLQLNFPQTWAIEFSGKDKHFLIMYPTLECGGEWELVTANKHKAIFKENIIDGATKCVQGGKVIITLVDENHISYSYFSPDSGKLEATSTLINLKAVNAVKS